MGSRRSFMLALGILLLGMPGTIVQAQPIAPGHVGADGAVTLEARAVLPADTFAPGPPSGGQLGTAPINGRTPPFPSQPVQGISAVLDAGNGEFFAMSDNGFGAKNNSADFLLRMYRIRPSFETARGGPGTIAVGNFVQLRDPDRRIPFPIVNESNADRLLTGADFDIESVRRDQRGDFWFGDEFGPFLIHTDSTGRVLEAPFPLPGVKSPQNPTLGAGEQPNLPVSRGFEGMALQDGKLYPSLEGALTSDPDQTRRIIYEFDLGSKRYTDRRWNYRMQAPAHAIGDLTALDEHRLLIIERDNNQGPAAQFKHIFLIDLRRVGADGFLIKTDVVNLLTIRDPNRISLPTRPGDFGLGDPFSMPFQTIESVLPLGQGRLLVANDNNYPFSAGRNPGLPDDNEMIIIRVPGLGGDDDDDDDQNRPVALQILAINDFHGALESGRLSNRPIGGAAVLAAYLDAWDAEAKQTGARTIRVGAGDLIGGSPPISALLQDEPTIEALGKMGIKFSSVGNHEFDEGLTELLRLQNGGCHQSTSCFKGARFQYLAANVVHEQSGRPILPPYAIEDVRGVKVGFIGVVLKETPTIVTPSGVAGLRFLDEAATVNQYVTEFKQKGIRTIVVLIHQGGSGTRDGGPITGEITPIVQAFDNEVDVVVSGHTHRGYQGMIGTKLVTQAFASGTAFADIDLTIDRRSGDLVAKTARIVDTFADVTPGTSPHPEIASLVAAAAQTVAPLVSRTVGTAAADITRTETPAGESTLGNLIADAQRWRAGTEIAFMNPGGIRADISAGQVTWGELFTVQPFGNDLVAMRLTGAQIERLLEQQWAGQPFPRIMKTSGISYAWSPAAPAGSRVDPVDIRVGGAPLVLDRQYTVVVNSFMAAGGDNFSVLTEGTNRVVGVVDLDALVDYVAQLPQPFTSTIQNRITTK